MLNEFTIFYLINLLLFWSQFTICFRYAVVLFLFIELRLWPEYERRCPLHLLVKTCLQTKRFIEFSFFQQRGSRESSMLDFAFTESVSDNDEIARFFITYPLPSSSLLMLGFDYKCVEVKRELYIRVLASIRSAKKTNFAVVSVTQFWLHQPEDHLTSLHFACQHRMCSFLETSIVKPNKLVNRALVPFSYFILIIRRRISTGHSFVRVLLPRRFARSFVN